MKRVSRVETTFYLDPAARPAIEVAPDERFIIETADSLCGIVKKEAPKGYHIDEVVARLGGACPVTGPVAVIGAEPGMALQVMLHRVTAVPSIGRAWTGIFDGFGALSHEALALQRPLAPQTRLLEYNEDEAFFPRPNRPPVKIPINPFLGTIAVAPRRERRMSFSQSIEYLGDVDLPQATAGATLLLPVNVHGALLVAGDAHAAQGDGEITGAAMEIEAEVELSCRPLDVEAAGFVGLPQLNTSTWVGSIAAFQGNDLTHCARAAYSDLVRRLVRYFDFSTSDAYQMLGQVGRLHVGNMIDPFYSVLASVDRRFVE